MPPRRVLPALCIFFAAAVAFWANSRAASAQGFVVSTTSGLETVRAARAAHWWL